MKPILVVDADAWPGTEGAKVKRAIEKAGWLVVEVKPGTRVQMLHPPQSQRRGR